MDSAMNTSSNAAEVLREFLLSMSPEELGESNAAEQIDVHEVLLREELMDHKSTSRLGEVESYSQDDALATLPASARDVADRRRCRRTQLQDHSRGICAPQSSNATMPPLPSPRTLRVSPATPAQVVATDARAPSPAAAQRSAPMATQTQVTSAAAGPSSAASSQTGRPRGRAAKRREFSSSGIDGEQNPEDEERAARKRESNRLAAERCRRNRRKALEDAEARAARLTQENQLLMATMQLYGLKLPVMSRTEPTDGDG